MSSGCFVAEMIRFVSAVASLVAEHKLWGVQTSAAAAHGLRSLGFRLGAQAQELWLMGLAALLHVGPSCIRD